MRSIRRHLSYANVAATLCLVLVLGTGVAVAGKNLIPGSKIKPHTITGKQVKKGSLPASVLKGGLVAGATGPQGPQGATGPTGPTQPADPIHYVAPATTACDQNPGTFCQTGSVAWFNWGAGYAPVGYFKDASGVVHLQGGATWTLHQGDHPVPIFYLPPGYRPSDGTRIVGVYAGNGIFKYVEVKTNGAVEFPHNETFVALDSITFLPGQ